MNDNSNLALLIAPAPGEQALGSPRSGHIWTVIVLTVALGVYYGWQVVTAFLMLVAAGHSLTSVLATYLQPGLIILFFFVTAFAVFRGYHWSLFVYLLGAILSGIQLLFIAPAIWVFFWAFFAAAAVSPRASEAIGLGAYLAFLSPIVQFLVTLYGAIAVYRKVYSIKGASEVIA